MDQTDLIISKLGISHNEFSIYKELLDNGPKTVLVLSKILSIPRTTVHQNIQKLIDKGLVSNLIKANRKSFAAEPAANLQILLRNKEIEFNKKESEIKYLKENISFLIHDLDKYNFYKTDNKNQIKTYEGINAVRNLYDKILTSKEIRGYVDAVKISKIFPENGEKFNQAMKQGASIRDIQVRYNNDEIFKTIKEFSTIETRYFPKNIKFDYMDYLIYDNSIAIIHNSPTIQGIVIENKLIYENAKSLFDLLWGFLEN